MYLKGLQMFEALLFYSTYVVKTCYLLYVEQKCFLLIKSKAYAVALDFNILHYYCLRLYSNVTASWKLEVYPFVWVTALWRHLSFQHWEQGPSISSTLLNMEQKCIFLIKSKAYAMDFNKKMFWFHYYCIWLYSTFNNASWKIWSLRFLWLTDLRRRLSFQLGALGPSVEARNLTTHIQKTGE